MLRSKEKTPMTHAIRRTGLIAGPAVLALAALAMPASAQNYQSPSWYGGGSASAVYPDDYDRGWGLGGFAGYHFGNNFRAEAELGWNWNDLDAGSGDAELFYGMVSGYYDFDVGQPFMPYIGAGIGYGWLELDGTPLGFGAIDNDDSTSLYHLSAGVSYELSPQTTLFGGYRWLSNLGSDPRFTDAAGRTFSTDYDAHIIQAGLRFGF